MDYAELALWQLEAVERRAAVARGPRAVLGLVGDAQVNLHARVVFGDVRKVDLVWRAGRLQLVALVVGGAAAAGATEITADQARRREGQRDEALAWHAAARVCGAQVAAARGWRRRRKEGLAGVACRGDRKGHGERGGGDEGGRLRHARR